LNQCLRVIKLETNISWKSNIVGKAIYLLEKQYRSKVTQNRGSSSVVLIAIAPWINTVVGLFQVELLL